MEGLKRGASELLLLLFFCSLSSSSSFFPIFIFIIHLHKPSTNNPGKKKKTYKANIISIHLNLNLNSTFSFTEKPIIPIETHIIIIGKNLQQIVIESAKKSNLTQEASDRFIIDNCKNIYLVGFETTAIVALLCLMLLASNKNWQDCARAKVLEICRGRIPNSDMLSKMKQLTMDIHETLRLYPPAPLLSRRAFKDMKFGNNPNKTIV